MMPIWKLIPFHKKNLSGGNALNEAKKRDFGISASGIGDVCLRTCRFTKSSLLEYCAVANLMPPKI